MSPESKGVVAARSGMWRRSMLTCKRASGPAADKVADVRPWALFLGRPPVVNRMAGSSVSLLAIAAFFRNAGYRLAYVGVSPSGIGIRPYVQVDRQVFEAFDLYRIRGWHHLGRHWLRTDSLAPWLGGPLALALRKCLPTIRPLLPTSIATALSEYSRRVRDLSPGSAAEVAFARRFLRLLRPDRIFIDYFYLTNILEAPEAAGRRSYVLTHQLFSERTRLDERLGIQSEWHPVSEDAEMGALAKASTVIAFQEAEARTIRRCLPDHRIVTTPLAMPVRCGTTPQSSARCLFVGSASHHNALGLAWFLENVWPKIRGSRRDATLRICGDVCRIIASRALGVEAVGKVPNLTEEYSEATLCLIPLIVGGGLKVKLVEALCHGRTGVTTSIGAQGLEDDIHELMGVADDPDAFAAEVIDLIENDARRKAMEARVLSYAAEHFSPGTSYAPLL